MLILHRINLLTHTHTPTKTHVEQNNSNSVAGVSNYEHTMEMEVGEGFSDVSRAHIKYCTETINGGGGFA